MSNATVQGHHVELNGVFVKRNVLIDVKGHREGQVTVGVNIAPSDDSAIDERLVIGLNDDIEHAAHAQIQSVVGINRTRNGHLAFLQELFTVVDVERELGKRRDAEGDFVGANRLSSGAGNNHGVIAFGQVVSKG